MEAGGEAALRVFRLSVDVRSFKAGVRLPMRAANVFVKVVLPPQIVNLALHSSNPGNAAKITAPLRSHPPVLVERSSEVIIPNGYVALELPVSVLTLAATLAQDPHLLAEVYHRDRYAADSIIGIGRISMAPLMHEPRLDGYVTVRNEKQVTTGSIRIILAAEELGPVNPPGVQHKRVENKEAPLHFPSAGLEESFLLLKNNISQLLGSKAVGVQTEQESQAASKNKAKEAATAAQHEKVSSVTFQENTPQITEETMKHAAVKTPTLRNPQMGSEEHGEIRDHVEYELAWEFEMWRRTEEAKWRAELKEKEVSTLRALEEDMKRKQMEQASAIDKVRLDLANLETRLRTKLLAVEKRDRALVLAEEEASLRREALERECAQRVADAEAAMKRVQADCQQKIELEHTRYNMLQEQYTVLEQRLTNANAALNAVENEFTAYKSTKRHSSETDLSAQILVLKHQRLELERKAETATKSRDEYKSQVVRLAKELTNIKKHTEEAAASDHRESSVLASLIEAHTRKANEEKLELKHLKEQVERLQLQEQTALAAATAAAIATAAVKRQDTEKKDDNSRIKVDAEVKQQESSRENKSEVTETKTKEEVTLPINRHNQTFNNDLRKDLFNGGMQEEVDIHRPSSGEDSEPFLSHISAFQKAEIVRLTKQRDDLLQTGVYSVDDRIIKGLEQEIRRLQSIDTNAFSFR